VILSFALLVAILYFNAFIRWNNYINIVYVKAEGLFDKYTTWELYTLMGEPYKKGLYVCRV